jgi:hypothetical protein
MTLPLSPFFYPSSALSLKTRLTRVANHDVRPAAMALKARIIIMHAKWMPA